MWSFTHCVRGGPLSKYPKTGKIWHPLDVEFKKFISNQENEKKSAISLRQNRNPSLRKLSDNAARKTALACQPL